MALQRTMSTSRYDHQLLQFSKVTNKECPATTGYRALNFHSGILPQPPRRMCSEENPRKKNDQNNEMKQLPLPPPPPSCPLNKSKTVKGRKDDDPFLSAIKQCTKTRGGSSIKRLFTGLFSKNKKEKKKGAGKTGSEMKSSSSEFLIPGFKNGPSSQRQQLLRSMSIR